MTRVIMLLLVLSGCINTDWKWTPGARMTIETTGGTQTTPAEFREIVLIAIRTWTVELGDDCPFPFELDAEGDHRITLFRDDAWPHADKYVGMCFEDHIDVRDGFEGVTTHGIVAHEFGHAFGLEHAPQGEGSLMSPKRESNVPRPDDVVRAREVLGCAP